MNSFIIFSLIILISQTKNGLCWDNEDLEVFDLVEEVNTNFYTLLGINQDADAASIRKAFRRLSLVLHPDKSEAENAEEQFRQLVSVYDVLKDPVKRDKYDLVLKNGLPNWKSAVYYYRHVRKVGIVELIVILFVLITIGQYTVSWASYIEQKFNMESNRKMREKRTKRANKGKGVQNEIDNWEEEIQKPRVLDTLPIQIPKLIWALIINTPFIIKKTCETVLEINERRKAELLKKQDEELIKSKPVIVEEKPKRKKKIPFVVQERTYEDDCILDPVDAPVEKKAYKAVPVIAGGFWSDDDFAELSRLTNKYPAGTSGRWERIANIMNRPVSEITHMSLKIRDNPHLFHKTKEEGILEVEDTTKKTKTKGATTPDVLTADVNAWSQQQQKAFENALTKYPKKSVADRWEKISKSVPNKTKEECILRYKYLVDLVVKQKHDGDNTSMATSDESAQ